MSKYGFVRWTQALGPDSIEFTYSQRKNLEKNFGAIINVIQIIMMEITTMVVIRQFYNYDNLTIAKVNTSNQNILYNYPGKRPQTV